MSVIGKFDVELEAATKNFTVEVLAKDLQPEIDESLIKHGKARQRQSLLTPRLTVWTILMLGLRRDLSYPNLLAWVLSGLRRLFPDLPRRPVEDGALTHARKRIGVEVLRDLFKKTAKRVKDTAADFHGWLSVIVDGTQLTMPDTTDNAYRWGKPGSSRGMTAFPQLRLVALVSASLQAISDVVLSPCRGEGTGEKTLALKLIAQNAREGLLFLLDRGFWMLDLLDLILTKGAAFILRVPRNAKLKPIRKSRLPDGSFYAWLKETKDKRRHKVRVIRYQIAGFKQSRLVTSILDPAIGAGEIVRHYHRRWEVELAYDSLKTHQCARRTGQCPTILRSKRADLVEQEVYAMLTVYNLVRSLMTEAARKHGFDPLAVSFVDSLEVILEAIPRFRSARTASLPTLYQRLLDDLAGCVLDRRRRPRVYRRAVKVKMSGFPLKQWNDREIRRDHEAAVRVVGAAA